MESGDILLSRWIDDSNNSTPGYWNHTALYVGNGQLIESVFGKGVIISEFEEWKHNVGRYCVLRPENSHKINKNKTISFAKSKIGVKYSMFSSISRIWRMFGVNCVSLVRQSYNRGGLKVKWKYPDCIHDDTRLKIVEITTLSLEE
jgi:uncharacterized protein YycO